MLQSSDQENKSIDHTLKLLMKIKEEKSSLVREEMALEDLGEALLMAQAPHGNFSPVSSPHFISLPHSRGNKVNAFPALV